MNNDEFFAETGDQYEPPGDPIETWGFGPYDNGHQMVFCDPTRAHRLLFIETDGRYNWLTGKIREAAEAKQQRDAALHPESIAPLSEDEDEAIELSYNYVVCAAYRAELDLARAARVAFEIGDFDKGTGRGLTDTAVLKIVDDFCRFFTERGTKAESSPTAAPCTAQAG